MDPVHLRRSRALYVIVAIIALLWLMTSIVVISNGNVGIITQFGKVTGRELQPGLNLKAPWPIQSVALFSTQIQKEQTDASASSTDLQQVTTTVAVNYHLERDQIGEIYREIGIYYKDRIIDPAIQESVKASTAKYNAADLITNRESVKEIVDKSLADRLKPYGIVVDAVSIVNFNFSDEFNAAIESKQVAQQKAEQAQYGLEQAQKDAQAQAAQKESLSSELLQKMAIEKWNGQMPQYVGGGSVFNIPLQ